MSQSVADIPPAALIALADQLELIGEDIRQAQKHLDNIEDADSIIWRCAVRATKVVIEAVELGFTEICPVLRSAMQSTQCSETGRITDAGYLNLWPFIVSDNLPKSRAPMLMPADVPEDEERRDKIRFLSTVAKWRDACHVAAAKLKAAAASNKLTDSLPYLELRIDYARRTINRDGIDGCVKFEAHDKPWRLFSELFKSGEQGLSRDELTTALWPSKPVQPNTLDQHKKRTNALIQCLRVEISADNRGVWTLVDL